MTANKKSQLLKLEKPRIAFENGEIPRLLKHEVNPGLDLGSRDNYLYYIMTCSLNFQRSSPNTWQSALDTWNDPDTNYVFYPERVVETPIEKLRESLTKHNLALQPNKHVAIWQTISNTFYREFHSDPRTLFETANYDTESVLKMVQIQLKKDFPYLSGPKLSNYFLFILLQFTDLELKNRNSLSVIPDTHIMQATEVLGILPKENIKPLAVDVAWRDLLQGTKWAPVDFHTILWNWSRNKFNPKV